ncbi:hypothetical protein GCM10010102_14500 [Promicromonospora citrea]|uniref:Uncharacterized protein n=1 Tax=Promicromonospora citrea TaxID=43677 RepID=A0A8H9GFJ3_9MICO|nr:hypothetical protein GCM10010102_14500 [Promicromonospora citrea]
MPGGRVAPGRAAGALVPDPEEVGEAVGEEPSSARRPHQVAVGGRVDRPEPGRVAVEGAGHQVAGHCRGHRAVAGALAVQHDRRLGAPGQQCGVGDHEVDRHRDVRRLFLPGRALDQRVRHELAGRALLGARAPGRLGRAAQRRVHLDTLREGQERRHPGHGVGRRTDRDSPPGRGACRPLHERGGVELVGARPDQPDEPAGAHAVQGHRVGAQVGVDPRAVLRREARGLLDEDQCAFLRQQPGSQRREGVWHLLVPDVGGAEQGPGPVRRHTHRPGRLLDRARCGIALGRPHGDGDLPAGPVVVL